MSAEPKRVNPIKLGEIVGTNALQLASAQNIEYGAEAASKPREQRKPYESKAKQ